MWRMADFRHILAYCIKFMHEVVPKVVAMAVRMVASRWIIFWISSFLVMVLGVMSFEFFTIEYIGVHGVFLLSF